MTERNFSEVFEANLTSSESKLPDPRNLFKQSLIKPDGRNLHLYSWQPISDKILATSPHHDKIKPASHLRWHPWREEWVAYAGHRQNRTLLPPPQYNPLAPSISEDFPTELPQGDYDIAVFDNLFPSLLAQSHKNDTPIEPPDLYVPTMWGDGACEVVVFTKDPTSNLGSLELRRIELILHALKDRYRELYLRKDIRYILPFENRGVEMGVTLHHPHGQIYAYPVVPPLQLQMLKTKRNFWRQNKTTLLMHMIDEELKTRERIIYQNNSAVAFVPVCARYPYEVWIAPLKPRPSLTDLTDNEITDLARALKTILLKYDGLWQKPFPYLMAFYAAPSDSELHPEWHFHIEFYPPMRAKNRLKYLAGTEIAGGFFINDTLPEEKASELRDVKIEALK